MKIKYSFRLLLASLSPMVHSAYSSEIIVDADGLCTLAHAIISANTDTATGACTAGSGEDTIILQTDVTLADLLPKINSTVIIEGNGHKIDGNYLGPVLHIASSGTVTVNRAVITGGNVACYCGANGSISYGGGIYNEGQLTLNNSAISGNGGGGIHNNMGTLTISNSTVSESKLYTLCMIAGCEGTGTGRLGDGIYMSDGGTVILRSSVVSGNFGREVFALEGTVIADSYNVFGHSGKSNANAFLGFTPGAKDVTATSDGTKPTALDAILSPLADNGGTTMTYALPVCSPAIDLDATCSAGLTTDQRGYSRPIGSGCDAGSFELDSHDGTDADPCKPAKKQMNMTSVYNLLLIHDVTQPLVH
jgi:hypothetical protein